VTSPVLGNSDSGVKSLVLTSLSGARKFSVIFSGEPAETQWWHIQFCPRVGKKWLHKSDIWEIAPLCSTVRVLYNLLTIMVERSI